MAVALGERVVLGRPVRRIEHDGTGVRVIARDGSVYRGDAAVVTLPPTLVGRLEYDPPLPSWRDQLDPAKAADMLAFLSLPATWRTLRQLYGWTYDQIEAWMVETALTLVTEPSPAPRTNARPAGNVPPA